MEVGVKVCFPRFQKGLEKKTSISLLPVTEGGGFQAFPLPVSQMTRSGRLSNLQTRLPGHQGTRDPVPPFSTAAAENDEGGGQLGFSLGAPRLNPRTDICTHLPFAASTPQLRGVFQKPLWG